MSGASRGNEGAYSRRNLAIVALACAVILLAWYAWNRLTPYRRGLPADEAQTSASQPAFGPPSPEEREERMAGMMNQLNLSEEQKRQIEALGPPQPDAGPGQRREQMARILTSEQLAKFDGGRSQRMQQKLAESKRYLSPQGYQELKERMERRYEQGGEFWGAGEGQGQGKKAP
ncbi:MAG: hypothetical protein NTW86_18425 [Candidatus Sumerlaeota bacterium]|nr:hypothetical protein [Candidatus Sumerlaeota bacterium]